MAFTVAEHTALKEAIASGVRSVTHGGTTVTYNSISDMMAALAVMEAELISLGLLTGGNRTQRIRFVGQKGLW